MLAAGGEDRRVRIWDLGSAQVIKELKGHNDTVYSLIWHQNSKLLASSGMDGAVKFWDIHKDQSLQNGQIQQPECLATYQTSCNNVINLHYSPHNTLVAVGVAGSSFNTATVKATNGFPNKALVNGRTSVS